MVSFCDFRVLFLWMILALHRATQVSGFSVHGSNRSHGNVAMIGTPGRSRQVQQQTLSMIGTGFSFDDGEQILVSLSKPMGMVLEQDNDDAKIVVTELDPSASAARAGVQVGDVLVAVQNASVQDVDLDNVLDFIQKGPRVMNLRFQRGQR